MSNGAVKNDAGKLRYDLLPVEPLEELVRVYTLGAQKYAPRNWEKGMDWGRVYAAMQRHANAWARGEQFDPVDGQQHLASVAWCALTLMYYQMKGKGVNDMFAPYNSYPLGELEKQWDISHLRDTDPELSVKEYKRIVPKQYPAVQTAGEKEFQAGKTYTQVGKQEKY